MLHLEAIIARVEALTDIVRRKGAETVMEHILSYADICRDLIPGLCHTWSSSTIFIAISAIFYVSVAVFFEGEDILSTDTVINMEGRVHLIKVWVSMGWRLVFPIFILVMASRVTAACSELVRITRVSPLTSNGDTSKEFMRKRLCGELGREIGQLSEVLDNAKLGFRLGAKVPPYSYARTATILGSIYTLMLYPTVTARIAA